MRLTFFGDTRTVMRSSSCSITPLSLLANLAGARTMSMAMTQRGRGADIAIDAYLAKKEPASPKTSVTARELGRSLLDIGARIRNAHDAPRSFH